jgi:hypothetical protein
VSMVSILTRHATQRWLTNWKAFGSPLSLKDWLAVQSSTLSYGGRVCWQGAQGLLDRSLSVLSGLGWELANHQIVDRRYCRTGNSDFDFEVPGTHVGLAFNPSVYAIIAGRLAVFVQAGVNGVVGLRGSITHGCIRRHKLTDWKSVCSIASISRHS